MAAIRVLCQAFKISQAASNVFVGVSTIAKTIREQQAGAASTPAGKRARRVTGSKAPSAVVSAFDDTHVPALIIVVAFFTRSHLLGAPEAGEYATQRANAIQAISNTLPEDAQQDETTMVTMIEDLLREAENGWLDMDWYHNLPDPASEAEDEDEVVKDNTDAMIEQDDRPLRGLEVPKRGFGSMMTDATDYLSQDRQAEYKRWKSGIMRRIVQVERQEKGKAVAV
jgi:origin recognition complex subunit 6